MAEYKPKEIAKPTQFIPESKRETNVDKLAAMMIKTHKPRTAADIEQAWAESRNPQAALPPFYRTNSDGTPQDYF